MPFRTPVSFSGRVRNAGFRRRDRRNERCGRSGRVAAFKTPALSGPAFVSTASSRVRVQNAGFFLSLRSKRRSQKNRDRRNERRAGSKLGRHVQNAGVFGWGRRNERCARRPRMWPPPTHAVAAHCSRMGSLALETGCDQAYKRKRPPRPYGVAAVCHFIRARPEFHARRLWNLLIEPQIGTDV